jgi:hypothetical protein
MGSEVQGFGLQFGLQSCGMRGEGFVSCGVRRQGQGSLSINQGGVQGEGAVCQGTGEAGFCGHWGEGFVDRGL